MTSATHEDRPARLGAAKKILESHPLDAVLVTDLMNVRHLCGFTGSNGLLLVLPDRQIFFTDSRYTLQAREETHGVEVVESAELDQAACAVLEEKGIRSVGLEEKSLPVGRWKKLGELLPEARRSDASDALDRIRRTKDETEVRALRAAASVAEAALRRILPMVRVGASESEVATAFHMEALRLGADALSFDTIVAGGFRGALPHAQPGARRFESGDLVVFDFGVRVNGYCSDETVTVPVGPVRGEARQVYDIVHAAQQAALKAVRLGVPLVDVDGAARSLIADAGYGASFGHGTGHGVGLAVHEAPTVSARSKEYVEDGAVFTVEPGIYLPGQFGVRLEDCLVVTTDGYEMITSVPKAFGAVWDWSLSGDD